MTTPENRLYLPNEAATDALGARIADLALCELNQHATRMDKDPQRESGISIHLEGDLGAGKTTFARAFLRRCGVAGRIKSPSYALLESYKVSSLYFYHIDFYRFSDPREWEDVGFRELFRADSVVLIEWPEKAVGHLAAPDLLVSLQTEDEGRSATLRAQTERGQQWIETIRSKPPPP